MTWQPTTHCHLLVTLNCKNGSLHINFRFLMLRKILVSYVTVSLCPQKIFYLKRQLDPVVPSSNAKNPMLPKMTNPAKKAVETLPVAIIKASLYCNRKILKNWFSGRHPFKSYHNANSQLIGHKSCIPVQMCKTL